MPCCGIFGASRRRDQGLDFNGRDSLRYKNETKPICGERTGRVLVQLYKREGSNLGLTVSGGSDRGEAPVISSIRPGSIADRSDCLLSNDNILAINGVETVSLKHDEIVRLVKNSGPHILIEVEYQLPEPPSPARTASAKRTQVTLERDGSESFGFIVRGGASREAVFSRPITVMSVRPGSSAERDGRIKAGDRILAINGRPTESMSCEEVLGHMRTTEFELQLFIEYDVDRDDTAKRHAQGPVLVEVPKRPSERLGISLAPIHDQGNLGDVFYIDNIREGSIADRCGLLQLGDKVISIDDFRVENMTLQEAMHRIKSNVSDAIKLEIIPDNSFDPEKINSIIQQNESIPRAASMPCNVAVLPMMPVSQCSCHHPGEECLNTLTSQPVSRSMANSVIYTSGPSNEIDENLPVLNNGALDFTKRRHSLVKSTTSLHSVGQPSTSTLLSTTKAVSRPEQIEVVLAVDDMGSFGFTLKSFSHSPSVPLEKYPMVEYVQPGGPAHQCSVIQEGDQLISVNHVPTVGRSLDQVNSQILSCGKTVNLLLQFEVADTVVPTSGIFNVKLAKKCESLGINLQAIISSQRHGQPLFITKVTHGGVAYRSGSIHPGDVLLAINNVPTESITLGEAVVLLQESEDVVLLRIQKEDKNSTISQESEIAPSFQVQLLRSSTQQPWGIVISGREDSPAPPYVFVDSLTPGGPAHCTGLISPGDLLLGINTICLAGKKLSQVRELLQQQPETVLLTMARPSQARPVGGIGLGMSGMSRKFPEKTKVQTTPRLAGLTSLGDIYTAKRSGKKIPSTDSAVDLPDGPTTDQSDSDSHPSQNCGFSSHNNTMSSITMTTSCHAGRPLSLHATFDPLVKVVPAHGSNPGQHSIHAVHHNHVGPVTSVRESDIAQCAGCKGLYEAELRMKAQQEQQLQRIQQQQEYLQEQIKQHTINMQQRQLKAGLKQSSALPKVHGDAIPITIPSHASVKMTRSETNCNNDSSGSNSTEQQESQSGTVVMRNKSIGCRFTVILTRRNESDSYGIGVSDGVSPKGVFISAIRDNSPAQQSNKFQVYDRILKVNEVNVENASCSEVVNLIAQSGTTLEILIQRRKPALPTRHSQLTTVSFSQESSLNESVNQEGSTKSSFPITELLYIDTSKANTDS